MDTFDLIYLPLMLGVHVDQLNLDYNQDEIPGQHDHAV